MAKFVPHGTTVSIGGQTIGGLIGVQVPPRTRGEAEVTDTDSNFDREWLPALRDGDSLELTFRYDPDDTGQQQLRTNYEAAPGSAQAEVIITLPSRATSASGSETFTFDAFPTVAPSGDLDLVADEAADFSCTLKVDGGVTVA